MDKNKKVELKLRTRPPHGQRQPYHSKAFTRARTLAVLTCISWRVKCSGKWLLGYDRVYRRRWERLCPVLDSPPPRPAEV